MFLTSIIFSKILIFYTAVYGNMLKNGTEFQIPAYFSNINRKLQKEDHK